MEGQGCPMKMGECYRMEGGFPKGVGFLPNKVGQCSAGGRHLGEKISSIPE